MRAHHPTAPLVVVRSEAESGRVGLRLIGELDLNTVELLESEIARTRDQVPPSVIDLSELRFLDLTGLRTLLHVGQSDAGTARLVGASGIVRRLIELAHALDSDTTDTARAPLPSEPTTRIGAQQRDAIAEPMHHAAGNGSRRGAGATSVATNGTKP